MSAPLQLSLVINADCERQCRLYVDTPASFRRHQGWAHHLYTLFYFIDQVCKKQNKKQASTFNVFVTQCQKGKVNAGSYNKQIKWISVKTYSKYTKKCKKNKKKTSEKSVSY